jgi:hypothetical protein
MSRNAGFPPEQVFGKKGSVQGSLSSQPHTGRVENIFEYFSFSKTFYNIKYM